MRVSVVMAAYNAEAYIREAVSSVLAQTHRGWELLVVDDGSDDSTVDIVESFRDDRIRVLSDRHVGVLGQVRNRGLAEAVGEIVAFLDADDVWEPTKLERQLAVMADRAEVGVVHTAAYLIQDGTSRVAKVRDVSGTATFRRLLDENSIYSSSVAIRRTLLERYGQFDPDPAIYGAPDYDLWLKLAPRTTFAFISAPLTGYRVHQGQMSGAVGPMERGSLLALSHAAARDPDLIRANRSAYARAVGMRRCRAGMPDRGRRQLVAALLLAPWELKTWAWLARACRPQGRARASL